MTLDNAPWALDGARTPARLARTASYIESGGVEGVIGQGDLKVTPLTVPGAGVIISAGAGIMLNRYQTTPNQAYAVSNQGPHTVASADMPPANASAQSHLVCVTVGDPEFSQAGHPWMSSTPIPVEQRETFQYVRVWVIPNVPSGTTTFKQLGLSYPAYALARIDVPASTSTITSAMIVDLRKLARPRSDEVILNASGAVDTAITAADGVYQANFPSQFTVAVPDWATEAQVSGFVEGFYVPTNAEIYGDVRIGFADGGATPPSVMDWSGPSDNVWDRFGINISGTIAVPSAYRGTSRNVRFEARRFSGIGAGNLHFDDRTTGSIRIRFRENVL